MNFKAVGKFILIDPIKEEIKNSLGMRISEADSIHYRYRKAAVVSVGSLVESIKEKDLVYYDKSSEHSVIISGDPFSVVLERDIVLVESDDSSSL
jgi:co-chaperonin GroES (HSP10)